MSGFQGCVVFQEERGLISCLHASYFSDSSKGKGGIFYTPSALETSIIVAPAFSSALRFGSSADLAEVAQMTQGLLPVPF